MRADDAQRRRADGEHRLRRVEQLQQHIGDQFKGRKAQDHDADGREDAELDRFLHALRFARAVVIGQDRHHRVVQAEDRHEDETLQFEIRAEDRRRRRGEGDEDLVHAERHDRANRTHDDRRHAHAVNFARRRAVPADELRADVNFGIFLQVDEQADDGRDDLPGDGRDGGAFDLEPRQAEPAENQDRVEHDVDDRADQLRHHRELCPACGLQQPLEAELRKDAEREDQADRRIVHAVAHDLRVVCLREEERTGQKRADQREQHVGAAEQEYARIGRAVDLLLLLRSERAREQRVHADCRAGAKGDHQVLQRERQRHGIQCVFTDARDEHAVHHVVERLHQHRDHHRDRHIGQQLADRHRPHLVFRNSFSHILHPELSAVKLHIIQTSIQGADLRVKPCGNEKAPS